MIPGLYEYRLLEHTLLSELRQKTIALNLRYNHMLTVEHCEGLFKKFLTLKYTSLDLHSSCYHFNSQNFNGETKHIYAWHVRMTQTSRHICGRHSC